MKVYYDSDADLNLIKKKKIIIQVLPFMAAMSFISTEKVQK